MPYHPDAQYLSSFFDISVQISSPGNGSCVRDIRRTIGNRLCFQNKNGNYAD